MTQRHLRRFVAIYLGLVTVALVALTISAAQYVNAKLLVTYRMEMARRIAYVTAMLEWFPSFELLQDTDISEVGQRVPFNLTVVPTDEAYFRSIYCTPGYPATAFQYSQALGTIVKLEERVRPYTRLGNDMNFYGVGFAFIVITLTAVQLLVTLANIVVGLWPRWRRWGYALIVVTLLAPFFLGIGMVVTFGDIDADMSLNTWLVNDRRTVLLLSEVYNCLSRTYPGSFPATLLADTFGSINDNFAVEGGYAAYVVDESTGETSPPVEDETVFLFLVGDSVPHGVAAQIVPGTRVAVAVAPIADGEMLIATANSMLATHSAFTDRENVGFVIFLVVTLGVLSLLALAFFPYDTIGQVSGPNEWAGPWAWRASTVWPIWKFTHALMLIVTMIVCCTVVAVGVAQIYGDMNTLTSYVQRSYHNTVKVGERGSELFTTYSSLLTLKTWNTTVFSHLPNLTPDQRTRIDQFYQLVFSYTQSAVHDVDNVLLYLLTVDQNDLPLLRNDDDVKTFLVQHQQDDDSVLLLRFYCNLWDIAIIIAWLTSNITTMSQGDTQLAELIKTSANAAGGDTGERTLVRTIDHALLNGAGCIKAARQYYDRETNWGVIQNLYNTDEGREMVEYEDQAVNSSATALMDASTFISTFRYPQYRFNGPAITSILLVGLGILVDFAAMALFYARSRGPHTADGRKPATAAAAAPAAAVDGGARAGGRNEATDAANEGDDNDNRLEVGDDAAMAGGAKLTRLLVPTNDFTAAAEYLVVNHHALWKGVRDGVCWTLLLMLVTVVGFVVVDALGTASTEAVPLETTFTSTSMQTLFNELCSLQGMYYAVALWLRGYVTNTADDTLAAVKATFSWSQFVPTSWYDDAPSSTLSALDANATLFRDTLSQITSLESVYLMNDDFSLFPDFLSLLKDYYNEIDFLTLLSCMQRQSVLDLSDTTLDIFVALVYGANSSVFEGYFTKLAKFVDPNCGITDEVVMFFRYLASLRRRYGEDTPAYYIATKMYNTADAAVQQMQAQISKDMDTLLKPTLDVSTTYLGWAPIIAAWICTPVAYLIYRAAERVQLAVYYS